MSLYLRQQDTRSDLQRKLAQDLQDKAKKEPKQFDQPDGVADSAYIEGTKQTTSLAWVWVLIAIAIVALVIWLLIASAK